METERAEKFFAKRTFREDRCPVYRPDRPGQEAS